MAKAKDGAALATTSEEQSGLAISDDAALASALDFDFGENDGLGAVDSEDFRLPVIVWNVKGKDQSTGQLRQIDQFYDTMNEKQFPTMRCALIHLQKSNSFTRFDNAKNENIVHCSSHDRVTGRLRTRHPDLNLVEGTVRDCDTCVDKEWGKSADGSKNVRNCDTVYGVFGVMLDEQLRPTDGFMIRFKRSSLPAFKSHLNKHHLNRRRLPNGKAANVPLYAFEVQMRLEVSKNGNFATPVLTRGAVLPKEVIQGLSEQAKFFAEIGSEATAAAEKAESRHESGADVPSGAGGNISSDDFVDGGA